MSYADKVLELKHAAVRPSLHLAFSGASVEFWGTTSAVPSGEHLLRVGAAGDDEDKRRYGYSREKRNGCVQVVMALVMTAEGFLPAYD
jgi:hypothetical protein